MKKKSELELSVSKLKKTIEQERSNFSVTEQRLAVQIKRAKMHERELEQQLNDQIHSKSAGSHWKLTVVKADLNCESINSARTSDLYVAIRIGNKKLYTSTIENAPLKPEWS